MCACVCVCVRVCSVPIVSLLSFWLGCHFCIRSVQKVLERHNVRAPTPSDRDGARHSANVNDKTFRPTREIRMQVFLSDRRWCVCACAPVCVFGLWECRVVEQSVPSVLKLHWSSAALRFQFVDICRNFPSTGCGFYTIFSLSWAAMGLEIAWKILKHNHVSPKTLTK